MVKITARIGCVALMAGLVGACAGSQKKGSDQPKVIQLEDQPPVTYQKAPNDQAKNPAVPAAKPYMEFADMTVFQGQNPVLKVHADGTTEYKKGTDWNPGPSIKADGTVSMAGKDMVRVNQDGSVVKLPSGGATPITITESQVTIKQGANQSGIAIAEDGTISVLGQTGGKAPALRVDGATTPGQRKTALTAIALTQLLVAQAAAQKQPSAGAGTPAPTSPKTPAPKTPAPK